MFNTIRGKIILGIVVVTFAVLMTTNVMIWSTFKDGLRKHIVGDMDKIKSITYKEIEQLYLYDPLEKETNLTDKLLPVLNAINRRYDCYISIDENENNNIIFTGRILNEDYKRSIIIESKQKSSILYTGIGKDGFYATYSYPIFVKENYQGTLILQKNYKDEYNNYKRIMIQIAIIEGLLYMLMLAFLFIWLSKITRSLGILIRGMELVGEGDYTRELAVGGNDEIAGLTEHFNRMQEKITKQMKQLYIEKKKVEELEKETKEFFNYATHEMKTPITAIKGYGELLEQGAIDEGTRVKVYKRIILEANRIHNLIQNMLIVAKGKGKIDQEYECFNLKGMISEMTNELELTLEKDKIYIEVSIKDIQLYAIKDEVRTIFKNLIENAIKYSKDKRICIGNADEKAFMIIVKNKCLPIPKNIREHLLEPFVKYNFGDVEKVNSGLGLFICKELIEKYNGEITYKIDDDEICFTIEFMNQESQAAKQIHQNKKINTSA